MRIFTQLRTPSLILLLTFLTIGLIAQQPGDYDPSVYTGEEPVFNDPGGAVDPNSGHDPYDPNPPSEPGEAGEEFIERCGTDELAESIMTGRNIQQIKEVYEQMMNDVRNMDPGQLNMGGPNVITIPVVFHIVHNGGQIGTGKNISTAQIYSQLAVLNEDFRKMNADVNNVIPQFQGMQADVEIEFCLASVDPNGNAHSGITRHYYNTNSWTKYMFDTNVKPATSWNPNQYLNYWVADLTGPLGYGTFPWWLNVVGVPRIGQQYDGIVCDYRTVGRPPANPNTNFYSGRYGHGRTGTHEVGHWLGLWHPWQNGCDINGQCTTTGDQVCDTPPKTLRKFGCIPATFPPPMQCGVVPMDQNFMDYMDDLCTFFFTNGQKTRMRNFLNSTRASIVNSPGCGGNCPTPQNLALTTRTNNSISLSWNAVGAAASYNVQHRLFAGGPWTWTTTNTVATNITFNGLTAFTPYEFRVQAVCNNIYSSSYTQGLVIRTLTNQYACGPDPYEPPPVGIFWLPPMTNNQPIFGLICPAGDIDWQLVNNPMPNGTLTVTLDQLPADYDLELRDANGNILAGSYNAGFQAETVTVTGLQPGMYYAFVFSNVGMFHPAFYFRLTSNVTNPPPARVSQKNVPFDTEFNVQLYPNPASNRVSLEFNLISDETFKARLFDMSGSTCNEWIIEGHEGSNLQTIPLHNLSKGIYQLELNGSSNEVHKRIVIN